MIVTKSQIRPRQRKIVLNNAEVLGLPTASAGPNGGIILAPAPGLGAFLFPLWAELMFHNAGNVTGLDDPTEIIIFTQDKNIHLAPATDASAWTIAGSKASVTNLLANGAGPSQQRMFPAQLIANPANSFQTQGEYDILGMGFPVNLPIVLFSSNAADFTGGNAANTLTIYLAYQIINV